ncbi:MAG TPA: S24 family peptidase [Spirochaetia bacterium]|nr:S24 family peptidase [Spirochaetia bacterium]
MYDRKDTGIPALGQYLAAQRLARGLSYRQMAARVGKAPSTIQSWEQGKRMPGLDDLYVLGNIFGTGIQELISLATASVKNLERQLATAEDNYRKASAKRKDPSLEATRSARDVVFLRNLIAGKQKEGSLPGLSSGSLRTVPVVGNVRAGRPRLAEEDIQGYTAVPGELEVDYALTVEGDSMIGAGIVAGDRVLVRKTGSGDPGCAVVALLAGTEVTIKHLMEENGRYLLRANNPGGEYPDIPLGPDDIIIGVVQRVVKRPGPPPKREGTSPS